MKPVLTLLKLCWKALNFIRDLVMNAVFLCFVILIAALFTLMLDQQKQPELVGDQGALLLALDGYLADNRDEDMDWRKALRALDEQDTSEKISTFDVVYAIGMAKDDERIKGLVLDLNYFQGADLPALKYIGEAINWFKTANKPVIAFADNYTQSQYLLASYADEIYLNPVGQVMIQGFSAQNLYFKSMLEKLEVTPHIFRVGTYKSAVEPFMRNNMSPEARANMQQWLGGMWQNYLDTVAQNRQINRNDVLPDTKTYLTQLKALKGDSTAYTQQRKLVTGLLTRSDLDKKLISLFGSDDDAAPKLLDFNRYLSASPDRMSTDADHKIAVVNVEGTIVDGESYEEEVGGDTIARLLRSANEDPSVYALILRVNSPGGSAFASEVIRQEIENLQKSGKPVVVSMGNMAASGGYWISSTADYIVADPNTITGSIGIFGMFPTFEKTLKNMGITADGVATSTLSELSLVSPLSQDLNDVFQLEIEFGYDQFLSIVAQGRKMSKEAVDKVAQGQVWLGKEAYEHKLVDELGDFDVALVKAKELVNAKLADGQKISDLDVEWFTEKDTSLLKTLMRDFTKESKMFIQNTVLEMTGLAKEVKSIKQLGLLNRLNDPKGQYIYCLNCGVVK